jgi:lipoprotein signal peptidase
MLANLAPVAAVALPVLIVDQLTKVAARVALWQGEVVEMLPFARLRLVFNRGVSSDPGSR